MLSRFARHAVAGYRAILASDRRFRARRKALAQPTSPIVTFVPCTCRCFVRCEEPSRVHWPARPVNHRAPGAYDRHMGRIIGAILGAILAMWLIFTAVGWFSAMLKTFIITALIAAVVFIVVWLLAGRRRQD